MAFKDSAQAAADHNIQSGDPVAQAVANEPHEQSYKNSDWLCSIANADRNLTLQGGGTIIWNKNTALLSFSSDVTIQFPNEVVSAGVGGAKSHTISLGGQLLSFGASGRIAAIKVSRTSTGVSYAHTAVQIYNSISAYESAISAGALATDRFGWILIAIRIASPAPAGDNDHVVLWDNRRVRHHDGTNNVYGQIEGAGSVESQYAQQSEHHLLRWRDNQNRNEFLVQGGVLSWAGRATGLSISTHLHILCPGFAPGDPLTVRVAGPTTLPAIDNDLCYYMDIDRTVGGPQTPAVNVGMFELLVRDTDDRIVLGVCRSGRLYLMDGTVLDSGATMTLGGLAQGVRWILHGPGDGAALYDLQNPPTGTYVRPAGSTPSYVTGGAELMVFVNGVRQAESLFLSGGAGNGDYQEESSTPGLDATTITWESGNIPESHHDITIFVGMAVPNQGVVPTLEAADSSGTSSGEVQLADTAQLRQDANVTVELGTGIDAGMPWMSFSAGEYIQGPVRGWTSNAGATERGLNVYSQRPYLMFGQTGNLYVSPGEIPLPTDPTRISFLVHRRHQPLAIVPNDRPSGDPAPTSWPALMYVYLQPAGATMGSAFDAVISSLSPYQMVDSDLKWGENPNDIGGIFIGSVLANGAANTISDFIPFDRYGNATHYRSGSIPALTAVGLPGDATQNQVVVDLSNYVPITAHAALLQVEFQLQVVNYVAAGGNVVTGINVYTAEATVPGTWPADVSGDYDVQFLFSPFMAAPAIAGTYIQSFGPFWVAVNDQDASGVPLSPASTRLYVGPFCDQIRVRVLGYMEHATGIYRHNRP
jgi:hypothetical protein